MIFSSVNTVTEIIVDTDLDNGVWVPFSPGTWFQPCLFDCSGGGFSNVFKIQPGAKIPKHYHTATVNGYTLRGSWRYLEHDWIAHPGTFIFEPPGEVHTLYVDEGGDIMITFFAVRGSLIYVDDNGNPIGYDDAFTLLELARRHFREMGLDLAELEAMVR
jgi:quercetin dioxygenase-like cupin family protein